ncbi:unnamed protein product, partial [Porites evermanni]
CRIALLAGLFDTGSVKYQNDSNYLKCHSLLAALHFALETTSFLDVGAELGSVVKGGPTCLHC